MVDFDSMPDLELPGGVASMFGDENDPALSGAKIAELERNLQEEKRRLAGMEQSLLEAKQQRLQTTFDGWAKVLGQERTEPWYSDQQLDGAADPETQ